MRKMKRLVLMVLCVAVLTGAVSIVAFAADSPSLWATEYVNTAIELGLVPSELQSAYTQATTRAEFASLAVTLYETVTGREIAIDRSIAFSDTTDVNVHKAATIGVVMGVGGNRFDPNAELTREQAAVMLARLANALEQPFPPSAPTFADNAQVSTWAADAVGQMQASGIMGGVGNNRFDPQGAYTREQSIVTIMRVFGALEIEQELFPEMVGTILMKPAFRMIVIINNPDWDFYVDDRTGILYFFDVVNECRQSLISMSVIEFSGNARRAIEQRWNAIRTGYEESPVFGFVYMDSIEIQVGNNYSGNLHRFELHLDGEMSVSSIAIWATDSLLYTVMTTTTEQSAEAVQSVLEGLFETFINLDGLFSD